MRPRLGPIISAKMGIALISLRGEVSPMNRMSGQKAANGLGARTLMLGTLGVLLLGSLSLSACNSTSSTDQAAKKDSGLKMEVTQVDEVSKLGNKVPDGQYMIAKVSILNPTNQDMRLLPTDFALENITKNESERYSQAAESGLSFAFVQEYGPDSRDKLVDMAPMPVHPRLQLERYFVFMVPADAKPDLYQLTYKPTKLTVPLISGNTIINDHRNNAALPESQQQP
jgi:hypothetical protein